MTNEEMQKLLDKLFAGDVSVYNSAIEITHPRLDAWDVIRTLLSDHAEKLAADYVRVDALDKYASELTTAQKRVAELETVLLHVNEHAKALQMRCGHVLSKPDSSGVSMFDLMGE